MTTTEIVTRNIQDGIDSFKATYIISGIKFFTELNKETLSVEIDFRNFNHLSSWMFNQIFDIDSWFKDTLIDTRPTRIYIIIKDILANSNEKYKVKSTAKLPYLELSFDNQLTRRNSEFDLDLTNIDLDTTLNVSMTLNSSIYLNSKNIKVNSTKRANVYFNERLPENLEVSGYICLQNSNKRNTGLIGLLKIDSPNNMSIDDYFIENCKILCVSDGLTLKEYLPRCIKLEYYVVENNLLYVQVPAKYQMEFTQDNICVIKHTNPEELDKGLAKIEKNVDGFYHYVMNVILIIILACQFLDSIISFSLYIVYFVVMLVHRFNLFERFLVRKLVSSNITIHVKKTVTIRMEGFNYLPISITKHSVANNNDCGLKLILKDCNLSEIEIQDLRVQILELIGDCFHEIDSNGYFFRLHDDNKQQAVENAKFIYEHFKKTNRVNETRFFHILFLDRLRYGSDKINEKVSLWYAKITNNYGYTWFLASLWVIFLFMSFRLIFIYNVSSCNQHYIDTLLSVATFSSLPTEIAKCPNANTVFGTMKILYGLLLYQFVLAFRKSAKAE